MSDVSTKVVGYFAYARDRNAICDGDSCVIAGSQQAMEHYVRQLAGAFPGSLTIRKTRFGEIMVGLQHGAPYSFDEASYRRFLRLARREGLEFRELDPGANREGLHLIRIERLPSE